MTLDKQCLAAADTIVPEYRGKPGYSCTGQVAKRWQAAYDAARLVLGAAPAQCSETSLGPVPKCPAFQLKEDCERGCALGQWCPLMPRPS